MDLPDLVIDAEHKNVLAVLVGSFTAALPQRTTHGVTDRSDLHHHVTISVPHENLGLVIVSRHSTIEINNLLSCYSFWLWKRPVVYDCNAFK